MYLRRSEQKQEDNCYIITVSGDSIEDHVFETEYENTANDVDLDDVDLYTYTMRPRISVDTIADQAEQVMSELSDRKVNIKGLVLIRHEDENVREYENAILEKILACAKHTLVFVSLCGAIGNQVETDLLHNAIFECPNLRGLDAYSAHSTVPEWVCQSILDHVRNRDLKMLALPDIGIFQDRLVVGHTLVEYGYSENYENKMDAEIEAVQ